MQGRHIISKCGLLQSLESVDERCIILTETKHTYLHIFGSKECMTPSLCYINNLRAATSDFAGVLGKK